MKIQEILPSCSFVGRQLIHESADEVFQIQDVNLRPERLDRARPYGFLFLSQALIRSRKEKDGNVTSSFVQMPDVPRDLVMLQELSFTTEGFFEPPSQPGFVGCPASGEPKLPASTSSRWSS